MGSTPVLQPLPKHWSTDAQTDILDSPAHNLFKPKFLYFHFVKNKWVVSGASWYSQLYEGPRWLFKVERKGLFHLFLSSVKRSSALLENDFHHFPCIAWPRSEVTLGNSLSILVLIRLWKRSRDLFTSPRSCVEFLLYKIPHCRIKGLSEKLMKYMTVPKISTLKILGFNLAH